MKKVLFILVVVTLITSNLEAQITKLETIVEGNYNKLELAVSLSFDENGKETEPPIYVIFGDNKEYKYLKENIIIASGNAQDIYDVLNRLCNYTEKFKGKYDLTYEMKEYGFKIEHQPSLSGTIMYIYLGKGYVRPFERDIKKMFEKFKTYCLENKIEIKVVDEQKTIKE